MINILRSSLSTEVQVDPEVQALSRLEQTRHDFKGLVNRIYSREEISEGSDREIAAFMHFFEDNRELLPFGEQQEIWAGYTYYREAFEAYGELFTGETVSSTKESLREIDPQLVHENRSSSEDLRIVQCVKFLFYAVMRAITSQATIGRYLGRVEYLGDLEQLQEARRMMVEIFSRFFSAVPTLNTPEEIDDYLDRVSDPALTKKELSFERFVTKSVYSDLDVLFQRELTPPVEETYSDCMHDFPASWGIEESAAASSSSSHEVKVAAAASSSSSQEVEVSKEVGIRDVFTSPSLMDLVGRVIPLDQIVKIEREEGENTYAITFRSPLRGELQWGDDREQFMADTEALIRKELRTHSDDITAALQRLPGSEKILSLIGATEFEDIPYYTHLTQAWEGMQESHFEMKETIKVQVIAEGFTILDEGFRFGLHVHDLAAVLYNILPRTLYPVVATLLVAKGVFQTTYRGNWTVKPAQLTFSVRGIFEEREGGLIVAMPNSEEPIHFDHDAKWQTPVRRVSPRPIARALPPKELDFIGKYLKWEPLISQ